MKHLIEQPRIRVLAALIALVALVPAITSSAPAYGASQQCPNFGSKTTLGKISSSAVKEASGLVASRSQPPFLWTHNDSGGSNEIFAMWANGTVRMTVRFGDVRVRDFEDISIGPGPGPGDYIYAADIGDNGNSRDSVRIYRFPEPDIENGSITIPDSQVEQFDFTYQRPTGGTWSRNAESLAVDPVTGDVVIVEKRHATREGMSHTSWFYRLKQSDLVEGQQLIAKAMVWGKTRYERDIGPPAAAEFSKDGRMLVVKNGYEVFAWLRAPGQNIFNAIRNDRATTCLYFGARGEAVAVGSGNGALYFVSEGSNSPVEKTDISIPPPPLTCAGRTVTIAGTFGNDQLTGTPGDDVINALSGDDTIDGLGGNDVICAGGGHDIVDAGPGDDIVYGSFGNDDIAGSSGEDQLNGGAGWDDLSGGDDDDRLFGGVGNDDLAGDGGFDRLFGGDGNDSCNTGPGGGTKSAC